MSLDFRTRADGMPGNIILMGFSGTGKSAIGRLLAQRLGWDFVDTDELIAARFGKPIQRIFAEEGEPAFREAEREIVAQVCRRSRQVVALGGGAVVDQRNRQAILDGNRVFRLEAGPETILQRLSADTDEVRPLLQGQDPLGRIRALRQAREEVYSLFRRVIDTEGRSPAELAERILAEVEE